MQHDDGMWCERFKRVDHCVESNTTRGCVVIGIRNYRKPSALEHATMVFPRWLTDRNACVGQHFFQKISADLQRPGATQRLRSNRPALGDQRRRVTKEELLHRCVIGSDAVYREIALRNRFGLAPFCFSDRAQHWNSTFVIEINADAQVDSVRVRIAIERSE